MTLFHRTFDGSSLTFNCVGLTDDELEDITKLIEENGGKVGKSELPLAFMPKSKYTGDGDLFMRVYDISFIKTSARRGKLMDLGRYRLTRKKLGERNIICAFLYGVTCKKCHMEKIQGAPIVGDSASSSESEISTSTNTNPKRINLSQSWIQMRNVKSSPLKKTQSAAEFQQSPARLLLSTSTSQESFHTANDEITIKCEPLDSQQWEQIPPTQEEGSIQSSSDSPIQSPIKSPIANGQKTPPRKISVPSKGDSTPRLQVLNMSELLQKYSGGKPSELVLNPLSTQKDTPPLKFTTAVPLTVDLFTGKSPNPESGFQITTNNKPKILAARKVVVNTEKKMPLQQSKISEASINTNANSNPNEMLKENETPMDVSDDSPEQESGPWIAPCDDWMHKKNENSRAYPTAEYIQSNDGKAPLLRKNFVAELRENSKETRLLNLRYREISDDSTTCDEDQMDSQTRLKKTRKRNVNCSLERKEQKSPDTLKLRKIKTTPIIEVDEEEKSSVNGANENFGDNDLTIVQQRTLPTIRDNVAVDYARPGPSGIKPQNRNNHDSGSDSDEPDEISSPIRRWNSHGRNNGNIARPKSRTLPIISDSDEGSETPTKRRKSNQRQVKSMNKKLQHPAFDSDDKTEKRCSESRRKRNGSDADSDESYHVSNDLPTDEASTEEDVKPSNIKTESKKTKALQYAKEWRERLAADHKVRPEFSRMKFTSFEQQKMVDFLCTYPDIERVQPKGLKIWSEMLNRGLLPNRTPQSIQNHFTKCLLPRIRKFFRGMSESHKKQFEAIQSSSSRKYL